MHYSLINFVETFSFVFNIISAVLVFFAFLAVLQTNVFYALIFLIGVYVSAGLIFVFSGAEYLGLIFIIVYVGAIAILFLFVIMAFNFRDLELSTRRGFGYISIFFCLCLTVLEISTFYLAVPLQLAFITNRSIDDAIRLEFEDVLPHRHILSDLGYDLFYQHPLYVILVGLVLLFVLISVVVLLYRDIFVGNAKQQQALGGVAKARLVRFGL
jgi:NADH-quinone oxidoreductase subunit J